MKVKEILWDWNGTLINDTSLCVDILNELLSDYGSDPISIDFYRNHFSFPISGFYKIISLPNTGIDFDKLSLMAKKNSWLMFVTPQHPGGTVYSKKEIKDLTKIIKEKNITVFSDELHCDLILKKLEHIPLGSMKTIEKNVVAFYSASKTFNVPGLNCAFAVIPCDKLRKAFKKNAEGITDDANITGLIALSAAFKKGWKWRDDLIRYLNKNLETLLNAIENHKNASPVVPEATYLLWVSLKNPKRKNLQSHFEKYGIGINDGIEFGKKNNIRINFATNHQNIKKASKRIEEALINL